MNGLIACDSYFGNTLQVAESLAEELRAAGHDVTVVNLHKEKLDLRKPPAADAGFLGIGGPTRMAKMSRRTRSFAKKLDAATAAGRPVFVFDTYGPLDADPTKHEDDKWFYPGGGVKLKDALTEQGVDVYPEVLRCLVTDMKGPWSTTRSRLHGNSRGGSRQAACVSHGVRERRDRPAGRAAQPSSGTFIRSPQRRTKGPSAGPPRSRSE